MSGATFILAINLFVAGLLASAFLMIAVYDTRRLSARWLALSHVIAIVYFLIEFAISAVGTSAFAAIISFATILAAMLVFNAGVARRYDVPTPWLAMAVIFALSVATCILIQGMSRDSVLRMLLYQLPYFAMQAVAVGIIARSKAKSRLDVVLMVLLSASALQFIAKAFMFRALGGTGATAHDYLATTYAMFSQSMGTVFAMAIALMMLVILVRDVLAQATSKSETDALSGLLNRGGFENHGAAALRGAVRQWVPVSLVIADLDHFKAINDNFGHASGDRVIETFAGYLREAAARHHVIGRIGGEEFAILLPGANLAAARLFAEGTRSAFGALPIGGLPQDHRCSASFGVAELEPGEDFSALTRRADEALYGAKKAGRDQVRVAARPIMVVETRPRTAGDLNGRG